jgi:hypothetical protein
MIMPLPNDGLGVRFGKRHDHPQVLDGLSVPYHAHFIAYPDTHSTKWKIKCVLTHQRGHQSGNVTPALGATRFVHPQPFQRALGILMLS